MPTLATPTRPRRPFATWDGTAFAVILIPKRGDEPRFLEIDGRPLMRPTYEQAREQGRAWASFYESMFEVVAVQIGVGEMAAQAYDHAFAAVAEGATA